MATPTAHDTAQASWKPKICAAANECRLYRDGPRHVRGVLAEIEASALKLFEARCEGPTR